MAQPALQSMAWREAMVLLKNGTFVMCTNTVGGYMKYTKGWVVCTD